MKPTDKIQFIKENVAPKTGIEVPQQVLKFQGKELPNQNTADDVGLQDGDIIDLEPKTIQVNVRTPDGATIPVTMKPTDKIEFIKEKVAPKTGIEVPQQVLKFQGRELPNDKTADDMGLEDGAFIDLEPKPSEYTPSPFDISVQKCWYELNRTVPYYIRINGWEKIGDLKKRILETRAGRRCPYLDGMTDPSEFDVYAHGTDEKTGSPMDPEDKLPVGTTCDTPLLVLWSKAKASDADD
ncbi:Ubiquitin-NEDD8-like protein RUB1 [Seminavis robusta]|uniref:Ubiquitin-NEDD8-like protein RUB1 n=1 Tax=Seminavis robusta TaxID=568900 RepID=A0A9N8HEI0_9STRA|nr:Ubiquitin-NEDD8-like protein RUB1 [Seminavis robusta]|eukprot:Sro407_g136760.1 Ubiquitin-NEDD8-like protein RUB1 (239) ;mRNA; f:58276-58992